jgi:catechol 2,3-dioxygenase-like lactoylglutathione lyase family enzyme
MYSHTTLGIKDVAKSTAFYDAVLGTLGHARFYTFDTGAGYGADGQEQLWILSPFDGNEARPGNGAMVAFMADNRFEVDKAYRAALENGGSDEGAPGLRPDYHENYYGAYMRDPDGNKLCVVCHKPG